MGVCVSSTLPLLQDYPRCVALLDSDTPTAAGVYRAEAEDADTCHAEATTMWELVVLTVSGEGVRVWVCSQ